jgi:hypothetical protein
MFYTIVPTTPSMFAVQPDSPDLSDAESAELLSKLERHFMLAVVLVSWNAAGTFNSYGSQIAEDLVTDEDLVWREFELPGEPEIPF